VSEWVIHQCNRMLKCNIKNKHISVKKFVSFSICSFYTDGVQKKYTDWESLCVSPPRVSPKTLLTYCTGGVLLRTLMGGDSILATVTHILVDEVHERNRFTDFLLIALRDSLAKFRSLRLILMSATIDTLIFTRYFNNCPVITGNVYVTAYWHFCMRQLYVGRK
jgi:hypothetical protein